MEMEGSYKSETLEHKKLAVANWPLKRFNRASDEPPLEEKFFPENILIARGLEANKLFLENVEFDNKERIIKHEAEIPFYFSINSYSTFSSMNGKQILLLY